MHTRKRSIVSVFFIIIFPIAQKPLNLR